MVAWLLVCVSEAETARREKRVRRRTKKKRSGKIYNWRKKKRSGRVKWVPVKAGRAGL